MNSSARSPLARSFDTVGWFARDIDVYGAVAELLLPEPAGEVEVSQLVIAADILDYVNGEAEKQAFEAPTGRDEIRVLGTDRSVERIRVEHGPGGHFGGDPLLHRSLFVPETADPLNQRAGARAGALSVLTGVAAARSADSGEAVEILPLLEQG